MTSTPSHAEQPRCLFCGQKEQLIWVHGHGQCAHCGVNAMPCCDGAACITEGTDSEKHPSDKTSGS